MIHPDKDVANAGVTQWHATTDVDATKSRYHSSTFERTQVSIKQQWPPPSKKKNVTSPAYEPLDYYL